jgi:hypothetical protein
VNYVFVYPNPASETIRVTQISGSFSFSLYDMQGRVAAQGKANHAGIIDVSGLQNGFYLLQIETATERLTIPVSIFQMP